jgi:hypothetical protein
MDNLSSDSLWGTVLPVFPLGTQVTYWVIGEDTIGNTAADTVSFTVMQDPNTGYDSNSAALIRLISPVQGTVSAGTPTQVKVVLRNVGVKDLTSASIAWTVNGVTQTPLPWTGSLEWDLTDTVVVGNYIPQMGDFDTVIVWVEQPNGATDNLLTDDTLRIVTFGCGAYAAVYTMGSTGDFANWNQFRTVLENCLSTGSGDITIEFLPETHNYPIDLTDISNYMSGHTLRLTSQSGDTADTKIVVNSGDAVTIYNTMNVVIQNLTIDAKAGTCGIHFTGSSYNILVRDCRILSNPTTTASGDNPIAAVKKLLIGTGTAHNLSFIHNTIDGGSYGFYVFAGDANNLASHCVFDSNTVINAYIYGVRLCHMDNSSVSYNRVESRSNAAAAWLGIYVANVFGNLSGNRIRNIHTTFSGGAMKGIEVTAGSGAQPMPLTVSNNEIILKSNSANSAGISVGNLACKILFNSIHCTSSTTSAALRGIQIYNYINNQLEVKGNNIVMVGSTAAYPIWMEGRSTYRYDIDYNNLYAPTFVGYAEEINRTSIADWQSVMAFDRHSFRKLPPYANIAQDLQLLTYGEFAVVSHPSVSADIEGTPRTAFTHVGCYQGTTFTTDAILSSIFGLSSTPLPGQEDTLRAVIWNNGSTTLTDINFGWTVNGGLVQSRLWTGANIPAGGSDTIELGFITYSSTGSWDLKLYIDGAALSDQDYSNDTLTHHAYICSSLYQDTVIVGTTGAYPTIAAALTALKQCSAAGDVVLALQTGIYNEQVDLTNISQYMNGFTLTLTSVDDSVNTIIRQSTAGNSSVYNACIKLNESHNIVIKDLTINCTGAAASTNYLAGIDFTGPCSNVLIRDCRILSHPTSSSTSAMPIRKANNASIANHIAIIHNYISGGVRGIFFYAGAPGLHGNHIIIDSNTVENSQEYAVAIYYADVESVSYNTISSRSPLSYTWNGLYFNECNGNIIANNRIRSITSTTNNYVSRGIYIDAGLNTSAQTPAWILNNEIILANNRPHAVTASSGINVAATASKVNVLYNSIFTQGVGDFAGIDIRDAAHDLTIKYNNVVVTSTGANYAHPIYLNGINNLSSWDIDYNNLYAPAYVARIVNDGIPTVADWQAAVATDRHSFRRYPSYADDVTHLNLQQLTYAGFSAPMDTNVLTDIEGISREFPTAIGCYQPAKKSVNIMLQSMVDWRYSAYTGEQDSLRVHVINGGLTAVDSITFTWEYDGTDYTYTWRGNLPSATEDTITIGVINHQTAGRLPLRLYVSSLGNLTDDEPESDTLETNILVCGGFMSGSYTIGGTLSDFATAAEAMELLSTCGANGDVVFLFQGGTYNERIDLRNNNRYMNGHQLTLTSVTGNAATDTIKYSGTAVLLGNSFNIVIKSLTIDVRTASNDAFGVQLADTCSNITVRDCRILVTSTAGNLFGIGTPANPSKPLGSIFIINNTFYGGMQAIRLVGGTVNTFSTHIVIDSNTIDNAYGEGINVRYTHCRVSNNTISIGSSWEEYGIRLNGNNGDVTGNRIRVQPGGSNVAYGIELVDHNRFGSDTAWVTNNQILVTHANTSSAYKPGIFVSYANARILYNSIRYAGNSSSGSPSSGIHVMDNPGFLEIKYNNIITPSANSYPIYLAGTNYLASWNIDYNNLNGNNYVGYAGGANRTSIADWQSVVPSDHHSVSIAPAFTDGTGTTSLKMNNDNSLRCPLYAGIAADIEGRQRFSTTQVGAYTLLPYAVDMALSDVSGTRAILNHDFTVEVSAKNAGLTPITDALLHWSKDGVYQGSYLWPAGTPLNTDETVVIPVGKFFFTGTPVTVTVWVDSVNNEPDTIKWYDTVRAVISQSPLAWFTDPLVADTIATQEFDVYASILEWSGALDVASPELCIRSQVGSMVTLDTIPMVFANGKWSAHIPPQYYGSKVVYWLHVEDTVGNAVTIIDSTFVNFDNSSNAYPYKNLSLMSMYGLDFSTTSCLPDHAALDLLIGNTGNQAFDFSQDNLAIHLEVTQPDPVSIDTVIQVGGLSAGENMTVRLTDVFPIIVAGTYDFTFSLAVAGDNFVEDDTLLFYYVSGRFGLPIDEHFSDNSMNVVFTSVAEAGNARWHIIAQGSGADADVVPAFGNGVLAFNGTVGSMTRLYTHQLDLSRTVQPNLAFWYFHDTAPSQDYLDVLVTIDGGATYTSLISLHKQWYVRGWQQYSLDLPAFAINQCVFIVFEAMERDRTGQTWQYLDRIRITAKQDLAVTDVFTDAAACDMENKTWKVVLSNLTDPVLDYSVTPVDLTLRVEETGQTYTITVNSGILGSFASDTITLPTLVDFVPQTYSLIAYFDDILDDNRHNDTFRTTFVVNPHLHLTMDTASGGLSGGNCLEENTPITQQITIYNDGNWTMEDFIVTVQISDESGDVLEVLQDTLHIRLQPGDSIVHTMTRAYTVPDTGAYFTINAFAALVCGGQYSDSSIVQECIDERQSIADWTTDGVGMRQNIPNPAGGSTRVDYTIPEDGKVVFSVYTVTGQTLVRKTVDAVSGTHSIEFDVTSLATGVYYYAMDYQGRKIVKKMIVQK